MWCLMIFTVLVSVQSVYGGYDYPKPIISFELPNFKGVQASNIIRENPIQKTISYSVPYNEYQYLKQQKYQEIENDVKNIGNVINSEQPSIQRDQVNVVSIPSESNIPLAISVQSSDIRNPVITDSNIINENPELPVSNNLQILPNVNQGVPPVLHLHNTETLVPSSANTINTNLQSLHIENNVHVSEVLNQESQSQLLNVLNIPPLINLHNTRVLSNDHPNNLDLIAKDHSIDTQVLNNRGYVKNSQPFASSPQNVNNVIRHVEPPLFNQFSPTLDQSITPSVVVVQSNQEVSNVENNYHLSSLNTIALEGTNPSITNEEGLLPIELSLQNNQLSSLDGSTTTAFQPQNGPNVVAPLVTKSISFHVPPPDIEERPVIQSSLPPQKNYKIIFIKVPTSEPRRNVQIEAALNNNIVEDKTLIYVLVKKPEEATGEIVVPQSKKPSEPEVFFVKYRDVSNASTEGTEENVAEFSAVHGSTELTQQIANGY